MGIFSQKTRPIPAAPVPGVKAAQPKAEDDDAEDAVEEKKVYAKEPAVRKVQISIEEDAETSLNTKLNALLYHTEGDSVDTYKSQNNSQDLLGRLYYDDYDASNKQVVDRVEDRVASWTSLNSARAPAPAPFSPRRSSPSPSATLRPSFSKQVSFDTMDDSHHQAITLKVKHPEFRFRRNNKSFLIGFSNDSESIKAVEWAFLEMVIHGDTIIVLQVLDEKAHTFLDRPLADAVLEKLKKLNTHQKRISLVYEVVIGNPQKLLKKAILEYSPAMMVVGTSQYGNGMNVSSSNLSSLALSPTPTFNHGHNLHSNLHNNNQHNSHYHHIHVPFFSKSSVSKYFLQYALVPVILVKPFYEIHETLHKPVDSEKYFQDWLANIDIAHTREKRKKGFLGGLRSPGVSRDSSATSLIDESRGRAPLAPGSSGEGALFSVGSRDSSRSRSHSRTRPANEDPDSARSRSKNRLSRIFS